METKKNFSRSSVNSTCQKKESKKGKLSILGIVVISAFLSIFSIRSFAAQAQSEPLANSTQANNEKNLYEMSLEELMQVEIAPVGTLTKTSDPRLIPAAVTTISEDMIRQSGAHNLNELLEIYVPNLQFINQHWEAPHLGLRGITGDRDDKYLLLVNGKNMNQKTHYGALSERDLVTLGDIHHIDIIRGPGSAIYGPGAVAMVISIVTHNATTFQGTEIITKAGAIETFGSVEVKHGRKLGEDEGIFIYAGVDKYKGAKGQYAPMVSGQSFTTTFDEYWVKAGHRVPWKTVNDQEAFEHEPRVKFYAEYNKDTFDLWARYTEGGQNFEGPMGPKINHPQPGSWWYYWYMHDVLGMSSIEQLGHQGMGYRQFTVNSSYKQEISDTFNVNYTLSFDRTMLSRLSEIGRIDLSHGEDEYYARVMANWTPNERQSLAFGGEYSYERYGSSGNRVFGVSSGPYTTPPWIQLPKEGWETRTASIMGEYQHKFNDYITGFAGLRLDKNDYTKNLFSPRFALVWAPNERDVVKTTYTQSVRMTNAEEMRWNHLYEDKKSDPETIENIEVRWERQQTDNLWFATSAYLSQIELIGWDDTTYKTGLLGTQKHFGIEGEITYKKDNFKISASHGYVKLIDFKLATGVTQFITSAPKGYGSDLANWANNISKIQASYDIDDKWRVDGSARIYWGFPGAKDFAEYEASAARGRAVVDSDDTYKASVFLNLGVEYNYSKNLKIRLDGTNLLGFIDKTYNKVLYGHESFVDYRSRAPSFILSLSYKF